MNTRDVVRRVAAYAQGEPLERGSTIHLRIAEDQDLLTLAFVRMGGESLPWAIGIAHPGSDPEIFAIPDARDRDRVGEMLVQFTPHLAALFDHPQFSAGAVSSDDPVGEVPFRQLWVPNGSHVQLLHMLNLRYTFARAGEPQRAASLRALGRLSGFLFREAARPGEATIIDATAALREAFTFPTDDLRQQHLGFLLALLRTPGDGPERMAAAETAERKSISVSLDPDLERDNLEPEVERHTAARRTNDSTRARRAERRISAVLESELLRRLELTVAAIEYLREGARPVNAGAFSLAERSTKSRQSDFLWLEEQLVLHGEDSSFFPPSPETDKDRRTGAARYHRLSSGADEAEAVLVHDDEELQQEALAAGDALRGIITRVEDQSPVGFRGVVPVWTVDADSGPPTRLRKGSGVCLAGVPQRTGTVIEITHENGIRRLVIEIGGWKTRPNSAKHPQFAHVLAASDAALEGEEIILIPSSLGGLGALKSRRVRDNVGVGAWLTHGTGSAPSSSRRRTSGTDVLAEVDALRRR